MQDILISSKYIINLATLFEIILKFFNTSYVVIEMIISTHN